MHLLQQARKLPMCCCRGRISRPWRLIPSRTSQRSGPVASLDTVEQAGDVAEMAVDSPAVNLMPTRRVRIPTKAWALPCGGVAASRHAGGLGADACPAARCSRGSNKLAKATYDAW